jgi:hypothetical protein
LQIVEGYFFYPSTPASKKPGHPSDCHQLVPHPKGRTAPEAAAASL